MRSLSPVAEILTFQINDLENLDACGIGTAYAVTPSDREYSNSEQLDGGCRTIGGKCAGTALRLCSFELENVVEVTFYNICKGAIRWQISKSVNAVSDIYVLALTNTEIY